MAKLTDVKCVYTGGGIYVYTARFNDEVWIATDFDLVGSYDTPWEIITDELNCDYESHEKKPSVPYPTWDEILDSIHENCDSSTYSDVKRIMEYYEDKPNQRILDSDAEPESIPVQDDSQTYPVGSGEITLSAHDAEELRIMLQTEYLRSVINGLIEENKDDFALNSRSSRRHFVDELVRLNDDLINYDSIYHKETLMENIYSKASEYKILK